MSDIIKFSVVGCVGVPNNYGGFEALAENLAQYEKFNITIYCSSRAYSDRNRPVFFHNAKLHYININANGASSLLYDAICLLHTVKSGERNILCLGISGSWILPLIKFIYRDIKVVTNVDGVEWRREKFSWLARRILRGLHIIAEKYSDIIICDNEGLMPYISEQSREKVVTIAYGGDHADQTDLAPTNTSEPTVTGYSLAICRIVPENNVDLILEAFSKTNKKLIFVGNWGHSSYSRALFNKYNNKSNISLMKENYNLRDLEVLRSNAEVYLHGHSAGGTNPSLVEAMFTCSSIYYFDCEFNKYTLGGLGKPFKTECELLELLEKKVDNQAHALRDMAIKRYSWDKISEQYYDCFADKL